MINLMETPKQIVAVQLKGEISAEDIARIAKTVEEALSAHGRIGLVVDFTQFVDATEQAIRDDMRFEFGMLEHMKKLAGVAIVTDKKWMGMLMRYAGHLMPSIDLKIYAAGEIDAAIAWVEKAVTKKPTVAGPAITRIPTDADNVYAFEIDGIISVADLPVMTDELNGFLDAHSKVSMLARIKHFGFDPAIYFQGDLLSTKLNAMKKLERYAIVGAPQWMQKAIDALSPMLSGIEIRAFANDKENEAWSWIGTQAK